MLETKNDDELWRMRRIKEIDFLERTNIVLIDITSYSKGKKSIINILFSKTLICPIF